MDYHSFGREDGQLNFKDMDLLRRMFEDPRKVPPYEHYIDTTQQPEDTDKGVLHDLAAMFGGYTLIPVVATGIVLLAVNLNIHSPF